MLKSSVYPLCALLCYAAALYKAFDSRRSLRDPAIIALIAALVAEAFGWTLSIPGVGQYIDAKLATPNLAVLVTHALAVGCFTPSVLSLLAFWSRPLQRARRQALQWIAFGQVSAAALVVLWIYADVPYRAGAFLPENAHRPVVAVYLIVYVAAFGLGLIQIFRTCNACARLTEEPWLRRGLRFIAIGALSYLSMCVNRVAAIVALQLGVQPLRWELLTPLGCGTAIVLIVFGLTVPSWGPRLTAAREWLADYHAYLRLRPLWSALCQAAPEIVLDPPTSAGRERLPVRNVRRNLYRRVIEIRDGLLVLSARLTPEATARAEDEGGRVGRRGGDRMAIAVAAQIRAALRYPHTTAAPHRQTFLSPPIDDLQGDIEWLTRLSEAFSRYPRGSVVRPGE